ncbi:hypothetical protein DUNSADRAFT_11182 [Dunaliella salina]|uniref:RanBP-type and C3HC4-type zinc finger-containing protein 1 n=1 Tax=Dunaliella salina TaxID=3046 RepID=A0ABQ7GE47_DUNSA|nr:hypothetical protein DUNSADRAFT_11182 [Dunaliella salina]|eukprot:KAF5832809.1 hypothetical protein DUNSADRAFT_11182 [Dunaliella salina]
MSTSTAITASVWGKGKQAQMTSRPLRPGEEECSLCRNDVPALVRLKGCDCSNYAVCLACVENLRATNIFRANKGVTCPFCRGYIECFEPVTRDDPDSAQLEALLTEANRAAKVAAASRAGVPIANKPEGSQALARTDWGCKSCGNSNAWWSPRCTECDQPGPSPAPAKPATWGVTEDVRQQIQVLRHPTMQKAFSEIAVPVTQQNQVGEFDESQMMKRLRDYPKGADKLLNLVKALSDPAFFRECSTHIHGNFTVQNLIEILARIRNNITSQKPLAIENFKRYSRGLDPFAQLLYTMLPMASELAVHTQGTYVAQKLIAYINSPQELFDVCRAVLPDTVLLLQDEKGKFAVKRTVEALEELHACSPASRPLVAKGINVAAKAFLPQFSKAMFAAGNHFGASVLSGVISMGVPCFESLDLGSRLATKARQLLTKGYHGQSVLSRVINSKGGPGSLEWYSEHMRDLLCIITMQLLDMLPTLVMSEEREVKLVKDLVLRLAEEQEVLWIEEIISELVNRGAHCCSTTQHQCASNSCADSSPSSGPTTQASCTAVGLQSVHLHA